MGKIVLTFILTPFVRKSILFFNFKRVTNLSHSDFPNCQNRAIECMFIHPETTNLPNIATHPQSLAKLPYPCKYFPYCSNPVCPYIHPLPQQSFYMQTRPYSTGQRVPIPCKNGNDCTRSDCHFLHPKDPNPYANVVVSVLTLLIITLNLIICYNSVNMMVFVQGQIVLISIQRKVQKIKSLLTNMKIQTSDNFQYQKIKLKNEL